jgi:NAD(P)-dependent dehydrogenase (short-subunit alcohol dehydrogenase family)
MMDATARALRRHRRPLQQRRHLAGRRRSVLDTSVEAWERVQAVNTARRLPLLQARHPAPARERGGGSVINVASFVAILGAATSQISYTASKGAVLAMSASSRCSSRARTSASTRSAPAPSRRRCC